MFSLSALRRAGRTAPRPARRALGNRRLPRQGKHPSAAARGWPAKISRAESSDRSLARTGSVLPLKQTRLYFFPGKKKRFHSDQTRISRRQVTHGISQLRSHWLFSCPFHQTASSCPLPEPLQPSAPQLHPFSRRCHHLKHQDGSSDR